MPGESRNSDLLRPQSPKVYRRRRTVALVLLLVVVAVLVGLVWWLVSLFRPGVDEATGGPSAGATTAATGQPSASPSDVESGSASASASASPSGDAAQALACQPGDIAISAATDQQTYGEGEEPVLELRVDNTGGEPCEANLGTTQQVFTVYSGSDRIFSTQDCQVDGQDAMVEISPDGQERARFTWPRVRSAAGCEEVDATPGSGTYRLEVSLGDLTAQPVTFRLQ